LKLGLKARFSGLDFIDISLRRALPYATDEGLSALVSGQITE
jgi:hypothetical protein